MLVCVVVAKGTIRAARRLHLMVLTNILHSCMSFFDTTPLGRILSRCGKDVDTVDNILPNLLLTGVYSSFTVCKLLIFLKIVHLTVCVNGSNGLHQYLEVFHQYLFI
jgi:ABC-type multidrug transport system, ATPase and permease components